MNISQGLRGTGNLILVALLYLTVSGTLSVDTDDQTVTIVAPEILRWTAEGNDTSYATANQTLHFQVSIKNCSYQIQTSSGDCACTTGDGKHAVYSPGSQIIASVRVISAGDSIEYALSANLTSNVGLQTCVFSADIPIPGDGLYTMRVIASHQKTIGLGPTDKKTSERAAFLRTSAGTIATIPAGWYSLVNVRAIKGTDSLNIQPDDTSRNFLHMISALTCDVEEYLSSVPSWVGLSKIEIPRYHCSYALSAGTDGKLVFVLSHLDGTYGLAEFTMTFDYLPVNSTSFKLHYVDAAHSVDYTNTYVRR